MIQISAGRIGPSRPLVGGQWLRMAVIGEEEDLLEKNMKRLGE